LHTIIIGAAPLGPLVANKLIERLGKPDLLMQEGMNKQILRSIVYVYEE
jgi:hypothetical protein